MREGVEDDNVVHSRLFGQLLLSRRQGVPGKGLVLAGAHGLADLALELGRLLRVLWRFLQFKAAALQPSLSRRTAITIKQLWERTLMTPTDEGGSGSS